MSKESIIALVISISVAFYPGIVIAWLFGSFFPGVSPKQVAPWIYTLWQGFVIALVALLCFLILRPVIGWIGRLLFSH
jgi:hypothetical protein